MRRLQLTRVSQLVLFIVGVLVLVSGVASASMYADHGQHEVGDIITIQVTEDATAQHQASTDASQSAEVTAEAGTGILDFINPFSAGGSESSSADGTTTRSGNLTADVSVEVEEVLDNGNLLITGERTGVINDEKQNITLEGIVRPDDVGADNTVQSNNIAQLDVGYEGRGVIGDRQQSGLLTRLFRWLF